MGGEWVTGRERDRAASLRSRAVSRGGGGVRPHPAERRVALVPAVLLGQGLAALAEGGLLENLAVTRARKHVRL